MFAVNVSTGVQGCYSPCRPQSSPVCEEEQKTGPSVDRHSNWGRKSHFDNWLESKRSELGWRVPSCRDPGEQQGHTDYNILVNTESV